MRAMRKLCQKDTEVQRKGAVQRVQEETERRNMNRYDMAMRALRGGKVKVNADTDSRVFFIAENHIVTVTKETNEWSCSCWHFANRACVNLPRWGHCRHVISCKELIKRGGKSYGIRGEDGTNIDRDRLADSDVVVRLPDKETA